FTALRRASNQIDLTGRTAALVPEAEYKEYDSAAHGLFITLPKNSAATCWPSSSRDWLRRCKRRQPLSPDARRRRLGTMPVLGVGRARRLPVRCAAWFGRRTRLATCRRCALPLAVSILWAASGRVGLLRADTSELMAVGRA